MGSVVTPGSSGKILSRPPAGGGDPGPLISIGTLARRSGSNVETIRFYEKIGILPKPARTEGGHRTYGPAHVERLTFIRRSRELGFTLDEVRGLLRLADQPQTSCAEVKQVAVSHLADVKAKIADLRAMQTALSALITKCDAGDQSGCPLVESLLGHAN